jgi:UDP-N-acetylmuramoyl-tripeptide--D-alanyl-D-alanine ligase
MMLWYRDVMPCKISFKAISKILGVTYFGADAEVLGLSTDSKNIKSGDLFVARKGATRDGHDFLAEAQAKGAVAAIVERQITSNLPQIIVPSSEQALGKLATWKRHNFTNPLLAITGSCGKTTTKEMLASILRYCGDVFVNIKSFNNAVGLPLTLWNLQPEQKFAIIELGANHHHEISYLVNLIKPLNVAVITNAECCHLEGFGSLDGVARAKAEIFEGLAPNGVAILNRDSDYYSLWRDIIGSKEHLSFGLQTDAAVSANKLQFDSDGKANFVLHTPFGSAMVNLPHCGKHNVMNALAAAAAATAVKTPLTAIKKGLENSYPVNMRMVYHIGLNGARIIDDTYNANPKAVAAALEVLALQSGEKIFVFGGMGELGNEAAKWHAYVGKVAKDLAIGSLYVCGKFAAEVANAFGAHANVFSGQEELITALKQVLNSKSVVLVKGSRGTQMEQVVAQIK